MSNGNTFATTTNWMEDAENVNVSWLLERFYTYKADYQLFTSAQLSDSETIFSASSYSYYREYYKYQDEFLTVDEETLYELSWTSTDYDFILGAGEITVAIYSEWDITDDDSGAPDIGDAVSNTESGEMEYTEYETEQLSRYETLGAPSAPTMTIDSDDENLSLLSYDDEESTGLKNRFGTGDIDSAFSEMANFFSSSAETLYNTMNISRYNFKKTNSPIVRTTNLSAIGTVAVGSALTTGSAPAQFASSAGGGY